MAFLLRVRHHGYGLQRAIDAPAFHSNRLIASFWPRDFKPSSLSIEGRFTPQAIDALRRRGHDLHVGVRTATASSSLGDQQHRAGRSRRENEKLE